MFGGHNDATGATDENVTAPVVVDAVQAPPLPAVPAVSSDSLLATHDDPAAGGAPAVATTSDDDLLQIKQQALQQLSPLIGHLEQSPEDKFRTTMMMIQASDDQALIKEAYSAAQAIGDEKVRAQALLDIVNEINYFTQQNQTAPAESGEAS